ncbi:MAG TPA: right-handed parallel beta-helix repeat-containing protein, partial [bacterium]|nr:right-handed parallel beta-helix repeat-containing protein [bacterium]
MVRMMKYGMAFALLMVSFLYPESDGFRKWLSSREALKLDPDVARYYTFEDVKDSKSVIKDVKGSGANLVFVPYRDGDKTVDDLMVIDGRFDGKKAVRLDRGWYEGPSIDIKDKQFTLSLWFRRQGAGSITSSNRVDEGSMVSVNGWDRGWSVATVYDTINTLRFCLGQPGGSQNVMSDISVPDNAWHHLGVTWDGSYIQVYFNGVLAGKKEYKGTYTPSAAGDYLRIGYDGGILGNVILDIDELVIYNRALNLREIRGLGTASQSPANEILGAAGKHIKAGDFKSARREYDRLKGMESARYGKEIALLNIAESYRMEKDYANAHKTYDEIFALQGLTANYRIYGMFEEAMAYLEEKDYSNARKVAGEIKNIKGVSENNLFRADLFIADTYRAERKYKQALSSYVRLLKEEDSSSFPHENQRLELVDRIENLEGLPDGEEEKSPQVKRAEWVNKPKFGIYVSLNGNDNNTGTKEKPFATIGRAREEVRKIKEKGMPEGGIAVYLRGGKYFVTESIVLEKKDSGTEEAPVVYRSYPGEEVRLIGGKQVTNLKPLTDPEILKRLPEESRGKVWVADLKAAGITDYGHLLNRGAGGDHPGAMELFFNTKVMKLSRWPNEGWLFVADLVTPNGDGGSGDTTFQKARFRYSGDRPGRWKEEKEIWTTGYFAWPWDRFHLQAIDIDTENHIVNLTPNVNFAQSYGSYHAPVRRGKPYYFYNILSEIDMPEEWYVDRSAGKLYFFPPGKPEGRDEIIVSTLSSPILQLRDASNIVFFGLTLECNWHDGVSFTGGRNNLIAGSTIRNIGRHAVNINNGFRHGVVGCDIYDIGAGGIKIGGGNWTKLVPSSNYVENNHIYRFNRFDGGYRPAALLSGIGDRVSHNLISDSSHQAIMFDRNNHVIEFNEIYDVVHEAKDAGVMYIYGEPKALVNRGHVIRYNFIHHISEHYSAVPYDNPGVTSLYLDALNAGITMKGNIFYRNTGSAIFTHGSDSRVEDNIFVDNFMDLYQGNR